MAEKVIEKELLQILVCSICHGELELIERTCGEWGLRCAPCRLVYPIRDAIPVMLESEALRE